jgi:hypothetical protein
LCSAGRCESRTEIMKDKSQLTFGMYLMLMFVLPWVKERELP